MKHQKKFGEVKECCGGLGTVNVARGVQGDGILRDKEEGKESGVDPLCIT